MPYVEQQDRDDYEVCLKDVPTTSGILTWQLTEVVLAYLRRNERRYSTMCEIVGALENTKAEFQRRVMVDYETKKCKLNGDVY